MKQIDEEPFETFFKVKKAGTKTIKYMTRRAPLRRAPIAKKKVTKTVAKTATRKVAVRRYDQAFSKYIRLRHAYLGRDGLIYAQCVSCGAVKPWTELQNGHYYTRGRYPTRWDEMNCNVQCVSCNVFLKGNYPSYALYMMKLYGVDQMDALQTQSITYAKITTNFMLDEANRYTDLYREILKGLTKVPVSASI